MNKLKYFEFSDFLLDQLISLKKARGAVIYIIFSTFGEREAELIHDKIRILKEGLGDFIDMIFLSHRRNGKETDRTEMKAKDAFPGVEIILCNGLDVPGMGREKGKGADMRRALFHINQNYKKESRDENIIIIFLDADVVPEYFGAHFVTGLAGAVLHGCDFAKAGFWRAMGRVKKFVAQPLFSVIDHEDLKNLQKFSYPLSGEAGGTLKFFNSISFWQLYGVETGINVDSCFMDFKTADVNLGLYDHEHHDDINIQKMAFGIIRTYFLQLISYGIVELKKDAMISNNFKASFINEKGSRESLDFDLTEKKYEPLYSVL